MTCLLGFKEHLGSVWIGFGCYKIFKEPKNCKSNYWLQTLVLKKSDIHLRNEILKFTNHKGYKTRPVWNLLNNNLPYKQCPKMDLSCSTELEKKLINLPSSVILLKENRI